MSDRKYRQSGYQDEPKRSRGPAPARKPLEPYDPRIPRDPKVPNMPGFREAFRCARCGHVEPTPVVSDSVCSSCGVPLHACIHCVSFDSGTHFECRQTIPARISPKDATNACTLFSPRLTVERETGSTPAAPTGTSGAKKAFDDLFKF
jgi:hypothetical protein